MSATLQPDSWDRSPGRLLLWAVPTVLLATPAAMMLQGMTVEYLIRRTHAVRAGDTVLIDTGCKVHNYISDITRTYVFGAPSERQRFVWNAEQAAQLAAFEAAQLGVPCEEVDKAARRSLEANGFGPGYKLPGLPHRTGHGIGLETHEEPYLVESNPEPLREGDAFSIEPGIYVPDRWGARIEDIVVCTASGGERLNRSSRDLRIVA